jgi:hypothetical protein
MDSINLINIFYSMTEFLFLSFFIFQSSTLPFSDFESFNKKQWKDKFTIVFQNRSTIIKENEKKELDSLYNYFVDLKRRYRNPLNHGFTKSSLLISLPPLGNIPYTLEQIKDINIIGNEIEPNLAKEIYERIDDFFRVLDKIEPFCFYMYYLKYMYHIPTNNDLIKFKNEMTTMENFKSYIDDVVMLEDSKINRDI